MDVLTGNFKPQGKLSFALPKSLSAVVTQDSDAPGYNTDGTLFQFGYGLTY
jgi:beta-glucosidase